MNRRIKQQHSPLVLQMAFHRPICTGETVRHQFLIIGVIVQIADKLPLNAAYRKVQIIVCTCLRVCRQGAVANIIEVVVYILTI